MSFVAIDKKISNVVSILLAAQIFLPHHKVLHVENLFSREQTNFNRIVMIDRSNAESQVISQ